MTKPRTPPIRRQTRRAGLLSLTLACGLAVLCPAQAQSWPSRAITIIVPFAAGGGTDVATRAVANLMAQELEATIVVDNRPGGNSFIGARAAARAAPDGHTLFMTSLTTHSINPYLFKELPYRPSDFTPVGLLATTAPVLMTGAGNPVQDVRGVIAHAARESAGLNFGVPNASARFATAMFASLSQAQVAEINFNSTPQAHAEVAAGRVHYIFGDFSAGGALVEAGRLKALAVAGPRRLTQQPHIPTMAESGLPGVEVEIWSGLFAPKGTPEAVVEKINAALIRALQDTKVRDIFRKGGQDSHAMTPAEFGRYVDEQHAHWGRMAARLNIVPQ